MAIDKDNWKVVLLKSIKRSLSQVGRGPQKGLRWIRHIKGGRNKSELALQGAKLLTMACVFLALGLGIGLGVGVWVDLNEDHTPINSVKLDKSGMDEESGGYILPVSVSKSQKAMKNFVYEEDLPQETIEYDAFLPKSLPAKEPENISKTQPYAPEPLLDVEASPTPPINNENIDPIELASIPDKPVENIISAKIPLWQRRSVAVDLTVGKPMIAIVIDDVGIDQRRSRAALELPAPLTLSFIPYGYNLQDLVNQTRHNGHEVMLHLPMEPLNSSVDPGPNALLASLDEAVLLQRIEWGFSQFGDYVGINNHMGSRFSAWEPGMRLVMGELKKRDLLFMDSVTSKDTVGFKLADEMNVPYAIRDVFLDHVIDEIKIAKQLDLVEQTARKKGYAVAIGHPHDETIKVLSDWLLGIQSRGFTLVPVSAIIKHRLDKKLAASG